MVFQKTKGANTVMISWDFPSCTHSEESCTSCLIQTGKHTVRFLSPTLKNVQTYVMNRLYLIQSLLSEKEYTQALHETLSLHHFYKQGGLDQHQIPLAADVLTRMECMFEELFFRTPRLPTTLNFFEDLSNTYTFFCSVYEALHFEVYFHGLVHYAEQLTPSAEHDKNFSTWLTLHGKERKWTAVENEMIDHYIQYGVFPPTGFNAEEDLLTYAKLYVKNPSLDLCRRHVENHFLSMTPEEVVALDEYTVLWLSIALTHSLPKSKALPLSKWRLWRQKALTLASIYDTRNKDTYLTSLIHSSNTCNASEDILSND